MDVWHNIQESEHVKLFLPSTCSEKVEMRVKKRRLSVRATAILLLIIGVMAIGIVVAAKVNDGTFYGLIKDKLAHVFMRSEDGFSTEDSDIPSSEVDKSCDNSTNSATSKGDETQQKDVQSTQNDVNFGTENSENAGDSGNRMPIIERSEVSSAVIENMTGRRFDLELLASMKSSVLPIDGDMPVCLVIHTHSTESYLSAGEKYFDPESETFHSENDVNNVIAVGAVFSKALNDAGVPTIHVTVHHDSDGVGRCYVNSRATVAKYLAKYPTIKYVFDIDRGCEIEGGGLIRDVARIGSSEFARIRISVGGRSDLAFSSVASNLAFAMRIRTLLCVYGASLVHPVLISDAIYADGYAQRTLKIDVGSCGSTLEEAKESAVLLAEAISCLLLS